MFSIARSNISHQIRLSVSYHKWRYNPVQLRLATVITRGLNTSRVNWDHQGDPNDDPHVASLKVTDHTKVKVLVLDSSDKQIGTMTFAEAQHLAMKKDLKLTKIEHPAKSYKQEVYQLLTGYQLQQERMKLKQLKQQTPEAKQFKGEKTIIIRAKITPHDLGIKIRTIQKWITQRYQVKITIHNDPANSADQVYGEIEKGCKAVDGRMLQKKVSSNGSIINCQCQPEKKRIDDVPDTDT